jgi:hypothetical protein
MFYLGGSSEAAMGGGGRAVPVLRVYEQKRRVRARAAKTH